MTRFISPRSVDRSLTVLLAGYSGYFGSHLYTHLVSRGMSVIPVARIAPHITQVQRALTYEQLEAHGLPDCDFIINVTGERMMSGHWDDMKKSRIETSRIDTNRTFADLIRRTRSKPYAYLTASCASFYPGSDTTVYDESFNVPPTPSPDTLNASPAVQATEMSLPYLTRLVRDWESASRVYFPHLDDMSPEQTVAFKAKQASEKVNTTMKVYGDQNNMTPFEAQAQSDRFHLISNQQVRVINFRMGALLSTRCPAADVADPYIKWGLATHVGTGEQHTPWIHVDDACAMYTHFMLATEYSGAVNCVSPTPATNKELVKFLGHVHHVPTSNWGVSEEKIIDMFGHVRAPILTKNRIVVPRMAEVHDFEFTRPNIEECMLRSESQYEAAEFHYGGYDNMPRNRMRKPKGHFKNESIH